MQWFRCAISPTQPPQKAKNASSWAGWYGLDFQAFKCADAFDCVRLARETRHLAIPQLYDKARFDRVIKKKAKLIVCLAKLEAAPWPQLTWDPKRNDEHRSAARCAGGYAAVRC